MAGPTPEMRGNGVIGAVPVALAFGLFLWFLTFVPTVTSGEISRLAWGWVPSLGVSLSFLVDGLSLTFALLISGIGTLVLLYANTYLAGHPQFARFALFLFSFMLAMLGLVLADNLIALFVFWELTTITSYLLIGFGHEAEKGRRSALQALFVTGAGALALLAGFIMLGTAMGSFELSVILTKADEVQAHALYLPILVLILAGAFTKSAQVPFHFWLPNAMAAPTPVSAFLHSATMVKAGVYLLARVHPAFSGTDVWLWTLTIAGLFTAIFASVLSLRQTDLKQSLAYTTLMALGTLTFLLAHDQPYALTAFATFLIAHSLYKACLFLMIGCVDLATGTRDAGLLGGLARAMPITATAAALAALSMAGVPPLLGFISKEIIYAATERMDIAILLSAGGLLLANTLMVTVAGVVAFKPFWRPAGGDLPEEPHEAPWQMWIGPLILGALCLGFGLFPGIAQTNLVNPTVATFLGTADSAATLQLWAGVNLALVLSITTVGLGIILYAVHGRLRVALARADAAAPSFDNGWDRFLNGLKALASWQTGVIQSGQLRQYIFVTFATALAAVGGTMLALRLIPGLPDLSEADWLHVSLALLITVGALITTVTGSRIAAMAALGVVGIGVAMVFIVFGAPDVAITQLLVETLVVVLVAVALLRLPTLDRGGKRDVRPVDAILAAALGLTVALVLLAVLDTPLDRRLTDFFEAASWPDAFGRNIVNVILVDFRALDTFGEIAVVMIAALSAYALLRTTAKDTDEEDTR